MALATIHRPRQSTCYCGGLLLARPTQAVCICMACGTTYTEMDLRLMPPPGQPAQEWLQNLKAKQKASQPPASTDEAAMMRELASIRRREQEAANMMAQWEQAQKALEERQEKEKYYYLPAGELPQWEKVPGKDAYEVDMKFFDVVIDRQWKQFEQEPTPPEMHTLKCWGGPLDKQLLVGVTLTEEEKEKGIFHLLWPTDSYYQREKLDNEWVMMYYGGEDEE